MARWPACGSAGVEAWGQRCNVGIDWSSTAAGGRERDITWKKRVDLRFRRKKMAFIGQGPFSAETSPSLWNRPKLKDPQRGTKNCNLISFIF
jgi:hypothetical protein